MTILENEPMPSDFTPRYQVAIYTDDEATARAYLTNLPPTVSLVVLFEGGVTPELPNYMTMIASQPPTPPTKRRTIPNADQHLR